MRPPVRKPKPRKRCGKCCWAGFVEPMLGTPDDACLFCRFGQHPRVLDIHIKLMFEGERSSLQVSPMTVCRNHTAGEPLDKTPGHEPDVPKAPDPLENVTPDDFS